jgi:hypothetical protein
MRQGISFLPLKINGKLPEKEGAAWMDGKWIFPIESIIIFIRILHFMHNYLKKLPDSENPKHPLA